MDLPGPIISKKWLKEGYQDGLEVRTLVSELSSLGLNLNPATNGQPGVLQAGWGIDVCAVPSMDVKPCGSPLH